jgi:hypothetical protein
VYLKVAAATDIKYRGFRGELVDTSRSTGGFSFLARSD